MKIALYYSPGACSLAPHVALIEIGLPFELKRFSTKDRLNFSKEYLAINPKGRIPALSVNDLLLTENAAILAYLGRNFPQSGIYPHEPEPEARCLEWLAWCSNTAHVAFAQILRSERFVLSEEHHPLVQASGHDNYKACLRLIEEHLTQHQYAVGDRFTVVDPFWLVLFRWGVMQGYDMRQGYPQFAQYIEKLLQRPSVIQALETEGISVWS
ncbi:MAG: glutathione S-transferase C-terminal domain-containing protein [Gammaproteobacteria bacterium]|nr:glutathione S-transferase C-terminal domain-containing protein [Gammaproteobacteria bacterium]